MAEARLPPGTRLSNGRKNAEKENQAYYDDRGRRISDKKRDRYLANLNAGKNRNTYYTAEELAARYGGYSPEIINAMGNRRQYLGLAPEAYQGQTPEQLQAAAIRRERDRLLAAYDYIIMPDYPVAEAVKKG